MLIMKHKINSLMYNYHKIQVLMMRVKLVL